VPEFHFLQLTQLLCPWALNDDSLWSPSHTNVNKKVPTSPDGPALVSIPFPWHLGSALLEQSSIAAGQDKET